MGGTGGGEGVGMGNVCKIRKDCIKKFLIEKFIKKFIP